MLMRRLEEENEQPTVSMEFCFPQVLFVENVAKIDIDPNSIVKSLLLI